MRGIIPEAIIHLSQINISRIELKFIAEHEESAGELGCGVGAIEPPLVVVFVGFVFCEVPPLSWACIG